MLGVVLRDLLVGGDGGFLREVGDLEVLDAEFHEVAVTPERELELFSSDVGSALHDVLERLSRDEPAHEVLEDRGEDLELGEPQTVFGVGEVALAQQVRR